MKLSDYLAQFLRQKGVETVFGVTGGAVVHLFDSVDKTPGIAPVFHHHEQAAAFAAEAYAKVKNSLGVGFFTTGPGGTNALTGLLAAWLDSVPVLYVSGQTRMAHTSRGKGIRQVGVQEYDILKLVEPMTKYAALVTKLEDIRYELEKAVHIALSGRPGPVWLDLPLDYQWSNIEPAELRGYEPDATPRPDRSKEVAEAVKALQLAKRPLLVMGYGLRLAKAEAALRQWVETSGIPFVSSYNACDLVETEHPLNLGILGVSGHRGANLAVQNSDLILVVGSHLCVAQTGTNFANFAREAKKIMVDIDESELQHQTVSLDLTIQMDAADFLRAAAPGRLQVEPWREKCSGYKAYNRLAPEQISANNSRMNSYYFLQRLHAHLTANDTFVVDGGGTVVYTSLQGFEGKAGQRLILSSATCSMGSGLPEAIGACMAKGKRRTICTVGDGSLQFNIQELQTIKEYNLPIKIFVYNNGGYLSIRQTQDEFLERSHVGSDESGHMSLPDYKSVAKAYGLATHQLSSHEELNQALPTILDAPGPALVELLLDPEQEIQPRQGFAQLPNGLFRARPLEDMAPLLDREIFRREMIVKSLPESE